MDLGSVLKKVAPWIAAAATGPAGLAGMAIKTAAEALGAQASTPDELMAAVAGATPEQLKELKLADQNFQLRMKELGYKSVADLEAIAAGDRASARSMQVAKPSVMPAALTWITGVGFLVTLAALFYLPIPTENRDLVVYMCGQLAAAFMACLTFWVGSTRASENKNSLLAAAPAIKQ